MSAVRLIFATLSRVPPASGKIIKEIPVSVASGTPYTIRNNVYVNFCCLLLLPFTIKLSLSSNSSV